MTNNTEIGQNKYIFSIDKEFGKRILFEPYEKVFELSYFPASFDKSTRKILQDRVYSGLFIWFSIKEKHDLSFSMNGKKFCYTELETKDKIIEMDNNQLNEFLDNISAYMTSNKLSVEQFLSENERANIPKFSKKAKLRFFRIIALREYVRILNQSCDRLTEDLNKTMRLNEYFLEQRKHR